MSNIVSDILRIDNLWQFENLRKLQLDNNIIEKIEGLENLTHLVWLGEPPHVPQPPVTPPEAAPQVNFPASPMAAPVQQELHLLGTRKPGPALGKAQHVCAWTPQGRTSAPAVKPPSPGGLMAAAWTPSRYSRLRVTDN